MTAIKPRELHHFNFHAPPELIARLRDFYVEVIGLEEGPMPGKASFPAYWLYLGDTPVVHLDGLRVAYTTNEIPAFGLNQIFLVDPAGLRIELNFFSAAPTL
jgi:catechol 2,3-dioxygenase-like lactoylglutathione lyase family enzyme